MSDETKNTQEDGKQIIREALLAKIKELDLTSEQIEVIWREGKAKEILKEEKFYVTGAIDSPLLFIKNRTPYPEIALVTYCLNSKVIEYVEDIHNPICPEVKGVMAMNSELTKFKINTGEQFTISEFLELLRFNRRYFADRDVVKSLEMKLRNFKSKIQVEVNNANDQRGNIYKSFEQKIEADIPMRLEMLISIYIGQGKSSFSVNLVLDADTNGITISLESDDLHYLTGEQAEQEVLDVVNKLRDVHGLTCIRI